MKKLAVILFNLGGPDSLEAVQPFLFNLFNDRAIIGLPQPLRFLLAKLISGRRTPVAKEIYKLMGGSSPIVPQTRAQALALEQALQITRSEAEYEVRVFISMRYWRPFAAETVQNVKSWNADRVVLLPLYPQYSGTTTGSSLTDWKKAALKAGLTAPVFEVKEYPLDPSFIAAHVALLRRSLEDLGSGQKFRVLFSAHGLPKRVIERGDPYQRQIEASCAAIVEQLGWPELDWTISYQSRVGPLEWIGPSTHEEIERAGREKTGLVVVPVAFVSEHSETLVELDIEYAKLADETGVPRYVRVAALGTQPQFIECLAGLVRGSGAYDAS